MTITITRLTPSFAARIDGADITQPVDDPTWAEIRAAFDRLAAGTQFGKISLVL